VYALEGLASLAVQRQDGERAVRLYAWADAARAAIGDQRPLVEQRWVDRDYDTIRASLATEIIAVATLEGQAMTLDQAIAYAREQRTL
jgi:hypothetical protein